MSTPPTNPGETTSASSPPNPMRASDADRERVCHILRQATGVGMLTLAEADDRLAAAYAARFRHELAPLIADIPDGATHGASSVNGRIRALVLGLLAMGFAARAAAGPVLARHKVLAGLAVVVALVVAVLLVYWGLSVGDDIEA